MAGQRQFYPAFDIVEMNGGPKIVISGAGGDPPDYTHYRSIKKPLFPRRFANVNAVHLYSFGQQRLGEEIRHVRPRSYRARITIRKYGRFFYHLK
ncbi:MAG TPA: hypothetical protein VMR33_20185 [Candidatus Baltobacteraceae bacterium]|nr:hypothetical protein [Candidatus Baltobacteraceae bacterium]